MTRTELALRVGPITVAIQGRTYPQADDPWDADLLKAVISVRQDGVAIDIASDALTSSGIWYFLQGLEELWTTLNGSAQTQWDATDAGLGLVLSHVRLGHIRFDAEFWPQSGAWETIKLAAELDQTDLPPIMRQCRAVLAEYPAKGPVAGRTREG